MGVPTKIRAENTTARAQVKPGCSRAGPPANGRTGGVGRPARFCQEQTGVLTEQFSSMEHYAFHALHLSDTIPEAAFHGQAVKTVAYLRVSTPQQDVAQPAPRNQSLRRRPSRAQGAVGSVDAWSW